MIVNFGFVALGPVLQTLPVTSIICEPVETVKTPVDGYVTVGGVAYAGAGRGVSRVEVRIQLFHCAEMCIVSADLELSSWCSERLL